MKELMKLAAAAALGAIASGTIVYAQVALLRWLAQQERIAQSVGLPAGQLYAHTDGDSWDYLAIDPVTTPAQDAALDAAAKKMGLPSGPAANLEFRKYIAVHTDTFAIGPVTP